jgi:hypothetical protein
MGDMFQVLLVSNRLVFTPNVLGPSCVNHRPQAGIRSSFRQEEACVIEPRTIMVIVSDGLIFVIDMALIGWDLAQIWREWKGRAAEGDKRICWAGYLNTDHSAKSGLRGDGDDASKLNARVTI